MATNIDTGNIEVGTGANNYPPQSSAYTTLYETPVSVPLRGVSPIVPATGPRTTAEIYFYGPGINCGRCHTCKYSTAGVSGYTNSFPVLGQASVISSSPLMIPGHFFSPNIAFSQGQQINANTFTPIPNSSTPKTAGGHPVTPPGMFNQFHSGASTHPFPPLFPNPPPPHHFNPLHIPLVFQQQELST